MKKLADDSPASILQFSPQQKIDIYSQALHYLVVQYDSPSELDGLKLFTNNANWSGASERGGLVNNPPNRRVPIYWKAFGGAQSGLTLNTQNESSWQQIKDQNDPGFASNNPVEVSIPNFPSGTTFIYFGAKMNSTTPTQFFSAPLTVSNTISLNPASTSQVGSGFGDFNTIFRPSAHPDLAIPYVVSGSGKTSLTIYTRNGEKVKDLVTGELPGGNHTSFWDGKAENQSSVASGIYFLSLKTPDGKTYRKKIVVIR